MALHETTNEITEARIAEELDALGLGGDVSPALDGRWVRLRTTLGTGVRMREVQRLLASGAGIPLPCKVGLSPRARGVELLADVILGDDTIAACAEAGRALVAARAHLAGSIEGAAGAPAGAPWSESLTDLLTAAGWTVRDGAGDRRVAALPAPHACGVEVRGLDEGGLLASVTAARAPYDSPWSRRAVAVLLLTAARAFRLVRPVLVPSRDRSEIRFEARSSTAPTAEECRHVLASLAVAHRACRDELVALQDAGLARTYLVLRGWSRSRSGGRTRGSLGSEDKEMSHASH